MDVVLAKVACIFLVISGICLWIHIHYIIECTASKVPMKLRRKEKISKRVFYVSLVPFIVVTIIFLASTILS